MEISSLPWGSRWARCSVAASVHPCWACVYLHHFLSSCRKLLSVHPWHPQVDSAFCWKRNNSCRPLKKPNSIVHQLCKMIKISQKIKYLISDEWEQRTNLIRILCKCCSTAGSQRNEEKPGRRTSIFVEIINSTGEEDMVTDLSFQI